MTALTGAPRRRALAREWVSSVHTILVKELRSRMRGRRAFIVLTVYLAILALIAYGVYAVVAPSARQAGDFGGFGMGPFGPIVTSPSATIGQWIFILLSLFQLILVMFIAPAFTAGQISLEREKQTLDLLISTPLRPGAIVVGKLLAALAFVFLLIVAAIPITAIVLMYGGASWDDIIRQQIVLFAAALGFGAIGLFFSALFKRTQAATVLTYCTVLAFTIGTVMVFIFWSVMAGRDEAGFARQRRAPEQLMWVNPMVAMLDVIAPLDPTGFGGVSSVLAELRGERLAGGGVMCRGDVCVAEDGRLIETGVSGFFNGHWWPRFTLTFGALALLLTLASVRLVIPVGMRFAFRHRRRRQRAEPAQVVLPGDGGPMIEEVAEPPR